MKKHNRALVLAAGAIAALGALPVTSIGNCNLHRR
jgi:hypothetical protein